MVIEPKFPNRICDMDMFNIVRCLKCGYLSNSTASNSPPSCREYRKLRSDVDELLNIIHRDNGEYTIEHGYEKSCDDAGAIILEMQK